MKNKRSKVGLALTTVMLLLVLAAGPAAPDQAAGFSGPVEGAMDGLHGLLASPYEGGGSGA